MTSKKTLAKKAATTMAIAAVAFSVVAQPLSTIVSADEVTPKAERQLLGATQTLVPVEFNNSFTTSADTVGFKEWSFVQGSQALAPVLVNNLRPLSYMVGATGADEAFTLNDPYQTKMTPTADHSGFVLHQNLDEIMAQKTPVGLKQTVTTIPGQTYSFQVDLQRVRNNETNNGPSVYLVADDKNGSRLGANMVFTYSSFDKFTNTLTFKATGTSTDLMIMGCYKVTIDNLRLNQVSNLVVSDITSSSTSIAVNSGTANKAVTITIGSKTYTGTTDGSGKVTINIDRPDPGQKVTITSGTDTIEKKVIDKTAEAGKTAVDALFVDNDQTKGIKDTTNQASIDAAQLEVNRVTDATTKADLQKELDKAQAELDAKKAEIANKEAAKSAADALFINNDPSKDIKDTTKQADIDAAQALVDKVTDAATKADLQKEIDKAQTQLDAKTAETAAETAAKKAADALFIDNNPSKDIKATTTQADIDAAQALVNKVTDATTKADLQKEIDKAQTQLDAKKAAETAAKTATEALFVDNNPSKDIKDTTTQAGIDAAQALVDKVTDTATKADLQKEIDKAQTQLDAKTSEAAAESAAKKAADALFIDNNPTKDMKDTTKQADIDAAQALVDKVTDAATKADLQKEIDKAQTQLDAKTAETAAESAAKKAADALFIDNNPSKDIKDTTKQADIDAAQALVNKVTDAATKADLQKEINKAQTQLDAKTAEKAAEVAATTSVKDLFINNDTKGKIKPTTDQQAIDAAQAKVDKVTDPTVKAALQKDVDTAQAQLDAAVPVTATGAKYTLGDLYI
ncbi:hypothetical protein HB816_07730 [Listeria booriae]|uniref:toxin Cry1Ac domain D-VI-related protein n=1 Tax=Listeria booriae TaxID=1552123 RepID=UPI00162747EB|nr:toxin Cry1Ac domain D-VI-related protein [Listeria booriae]MBC1230330.1 hypothetical protein [Listeria booriae]